MSQEGSGFDWSDQAEEAFNNQALMAEITSTNSEIPTEVQSNLCSKACFETVEKYREHNQSMCDNLKRLEQDRRESSKILEKFEEQICYDLNYWKWEKKELETQLENAKKELEQVKCQFEKAQLDIEKFSNASKAVDSLLKAQVHDKLKRGI